MPYFVEDHTYSPIIIVRLTGEPTDEEFQSYLNALDRRLLVAKRYGHVLDVSGTRSANPAHRKMQADWISRHRDRIEREAYGTALVMPQPLQRFFFSSIMLLTPMPSRTKAVASVEEGVAFVAEGMVALGDEVPEHIRAFLQRCRDGTPASASV